MATRRVASALTRSQLSAIAELIAAYQKLDQTALRKYQETEVRTNFIDKLFSILGWDMHDRDQVERETTVDEGKRPDYIFKLNTVAHLYLEAKAFREDARNLDFARDAITKAYNKGVDWAGVTNFTDIVIFDAKEDVGSNARPRGVLDLNLAQYAEQGSRLWLLTPTAIGTGDLTSRAIETGIRRRPVPIEKKLYQSMRKWREDLHNGLARFLDWTTDAQFRAGDDAIQNLIDRLIFLRNCEDRGFDEPQLRALSHKIAKGDRRSAYVTKEIIGLFGAAAATYDSEIFQKNAPIDTYLIQLQNRTDLDDILADVVLGLYRVPKSFADYDFAEMGEDVLGQVYEQYLSYVPQRQKKATQTPRLPGMENPNIAIMAPKLRRKEQGIFYTPAWVVKYIVDNTVGRFLRENADHPDRIDNLRIVDPACGSGSFLIRAYETLLKYHASTLGVSVDDLDIPIRARILRRNIFGVDLDPQAVEIARLNLLIRMVRKREALPELKDNIRLGNSILFGSDRQLRSNLGSNYLDRMPFDWKRQFSKIMKEGGFDVVIGNPPYVKEYVSREPFADLQASAIARYYEGKSDIWYAFTALAIDILKEGGLNSFIATNNWNTNAGATILRGKVLSEAQLVEYIDFGDYRVFEHAGIQTMVYVLKKDKSGHTGKVRYARITDPAVSEATIAGFLATADARQAAQFATAFDANLRIDNGKPFTFADSSSDKLLSRISSVGTTKLKASEVTQGIITPQDSVTTSHLEHLEKGIKVGDGIFVLTDAERKDLGKLSAEERRLIKPYYTTRQILRYHTKPKNRLWILYITQAVAANINRYPNIKHHLDRFTTVMTSDNKPYGLHRARKDAFFNGEKIVSVRKTAVPAFSISTFPTYVSQTFFVIKPETWDVRLLCALLNSKVIEYWLHKRGKKQGDALQIDKAPLLELPLRKAANPKEKAMERKIVRLVASLLDVNAKLDDAVASEREQLLRRLLGLEADIHSAVFDLYGISDRERELIEAELVAVRGPDPTLIPSQSGTSAAPSDDSGD